jgi:lipopolysaccharide/colanic/teichoic acid biosynthesis glycosyltransferase
MRQSGGRIRSDDGSAPSGVRSFRRGAVSEDQRRAEFGAPGSRAKRLLDVVIALLLVIALIPVIVVLALVVKLDSRGPVFYRCRRVGRGGREFAMLKFRKMHDDAEGPALTSHLDERYTGVGSFLARTKLDELPQLWNVIRGEMSLVGPRPEDPSFVALYPRHYAEILRAKPGITGLSQLAFAREGRLLEGADRVSRYVERLLPQKIAIDRFYVAHRSTRTDLRILVWTVVMVLCGTEVAVHRRNGAISVRRRAQPNAASRAPEVDAENVTVAGEQARA